MQLADVAGADPESVNRSLSAAPGEAATWELRECSELTLCTYRRAGGVADVVNRSAQAAYDTLTSA